METGEISSGLLSRVSNNAHNTKSAAARIAISTRIWMATLCVLVLLGGCTESPTSPAHDVVTAGTLIPNNDYILEPIIVIGTPGCDPYLSANFCQGPGTGTCITTDPDEPTDPEFSSVSSCPGDDTGGGGGSGGGESGSNGGDGSTTQPPSDEPPPVDSCQTGDQMIDAPDVYRTFQQLWMKSKLMGVEQGGWIVSDGGTLRLIPFQNAQYSACGIDIYESPPNGTVAMMHTHPWPLWASTPCGGLNTGTPSDEDRAALNLVGLAVGYFLDEGGIGKYTANAGIKAIRAERCGY